MAIAYLSLGSNKGDRIGFVQQAAALLGGDEKISIVRTSAFYETEPWNMNTKTWFASPYGLVKLKNSDKKCNAYFIALGANDLSLGNNYVGTSSDINTSDSTQNSDTFYGNYGKIISEIKTVQPKAKIFLMTIMVTA